jgi:hypothetical protein
VWVFYSEEVPKRDDPAVRPRGARAERAAVVAVAPAAADPSNKNSIEVTLNCPGQTLTGITIEHNNPSSSRSTASTSSPSRR